VAVVLDRQEKGNLIDVEKLGKVGLAEIAKALEKVGQEHVHQDRPLRWYDRERPDEDDEFDEDDKFVYKASDEEGQGYEASQN
jgi:hypothetical protein